MICWKCRLSMSRDSCVVWLKKSCHDHPQSPTCTLCAIKSISCHNRYTKTNKLPVMFTKLELDQSGNRRTEWSMCSADNAAIKPEPIRDSLMSGRWGGKRKWRFMCWRRKEGCLLDWRTRAFSVNHRCYLAGGTARGTIPEVRRFRVARRDSGRHSLDSFRSE